MNTANDLQLGLIDRNLFTSAKCWFAAAIALRCSAAAVGLLALCEFFAFIAPVLVVVLACAAEICSMRSDIMKGRADRLLRIRELHDGFGWQPDRGAVADVLATLSERSSRFGTASSGEFESQQPAGPTRAIQNVAESAWWTKQLALIMLKLTSAIALLVLLVSLIFLVVSLRVAVSTQTGIAIARVATAALATIFSAGIVKLGFAYYTLYERAGTSARRAAAAFTTDDPIQALLLVYEYQNARSMGPLIPDSVYRDKRTQLSRLWSLQSAGNSRPED